MRIQQSLLIAGLLLGSATGALAVPVTFQVDMSYQEAQGSFDPTVDQVEARGAFNGWSGGFQLAPTVANTNIYAGTFDVSGTAGSAVEYKFVRVTGGNANWESNNNRSFTLGSAAQTLPVAFFNNQWDGAPLNVTFQVNMASQIAAGNFTPENGDVVEARGEFNSWSGGFILTPSEDNPDIYIGTASAPEAPGSQVQYKFHIARVGAAEIWENDPNRSFTQTNADQTLPAVYFNNVTGVLIKGAVNFAVDMNAQIAGGHFDPATQEVWARGNKIGWGNPPGEGLQLIADASRSGVYTNTMSLTNIFTAETVEFKFTIWDPATSGTTWEDGANKVVSFTGTEPLNAAGYHVKDFGKVYFNGISPAEILTADTVVTFRVNMNGALPTGGGAPFDPLTQAVWLNGSFVNNGSWGAWGAQDPSLQMFDDGATGGDTVAGDGIYSAQWTFPKGSPTRVTYKYGINDLDNEAPSGSDHARYIRATGNYTFPVDKFGTITTESLDLGNISIALTSPGKVTLSWTGAAGVKVQKITDLANPSTATEVANTDGQSSVEITADGQAGFFRLVRP